MALEVYNAASVGQLASEFESIAQQLRIVQGRMLGGQDLTEVAWNLNSFHHRMNDAKGYLTAAIAKFERESELKKKKLARGAAKVNSALEAAKSRKKPPTS